jgi:hypothetical protein
MKCPSRARGSLGIHSRILHLLPTPWFLDVPSRRGRGRLEVLIHLQGGQSPQPQKRLGSQSPQGRDHQGGQKKEYLGLTKDLCRPLENLQQSGRSWGENEEIARSCISKQ